MHFRQAANSSLRKMSDDPADKVSKYYPSRLAFQQSRGCASDTCLGMRQASECCGSALRALLHSSRLLAVICLLQIKARPEDIALVRARGLSAASRPAIQSCMLTFQIRACWSRGFCDASQTGCVSLPVAEKAPFGIDRSAQHHEQHSVALYGNTMRVQLPDKESGSFDSLHKKSKHFILEIELSCIYDTQPDAFLPLLLHEN